MHLYRLEKNLMSNVQETPQHVRSVRRRLDKHKIDDLIQQKREEIIAEKEREELEQREQMDQNAERQSIFDMILTPFGTGSGSGDGDEMDGHSIRRAKEKRVAFVDLKKTDIPPDGNFWGSGYFVYWSDKHNRPYFYNPKWTRRSGFRLTRTGKMMMM